MTHPLRNQLFNALYWDICTEIGVDIKAKSRKLDYISGRSIFVDIVNDLFDLNNINGFRKPITTTIIGEYLGLNHSSVVTIRKKDWVVHNKATHDTYKRLKVKYFGVEYKALVKQIQEENYFPRGKIPVNSL